MMYKFQESIPRVPLPRLEETCDRYLQIVAPLLSDIELAQTRAVVMDFQQGNGPELQRQLEMIVQSTNNSYLYQLVEESYLENRFSLPINTNFGTVLSSPSASSNPTRFAANLIYKALKFYLKVKNRELEPDSDIYQKGFHPLCMVQYDNLFGTARIPGIKCDRIQRTINQEHIVVIRRNVFYALHLIQGEKLATVDAIAHQLDWIIENTPPGSPALGALTALPRAKWALLRSYIATLVPENARSLAVLDSALFVVCWDEITPTEVEAASKNALHGDGRNRWFDKPLQLIFTSSGHSAINLEHTGFDGYTIMRFLATVNGDRQQQDEPVSTATAIECPPPLRLEWNLTHKLLEEIEQASTAVESLIAQNETCVLEFNQFGRDSIKQHNLSPDAVVQLSLQVAYARLHGEIACTSETVHTRNFQYGRWEDVRVVTPESVRLIQAFTEAIPNQARYSALKLAVAAHVARQLACKQGQGIERHLFALYTLARYQDSVPGIFLDKAYTELFSQPVLCTSSLAAKMGLAVFCFGPVVSHGYGVGYLIGCDTITFCVTSKYRQTEKYIQHIRHCLSEMEELLITMS